MIIAAAEQVMMERINTSRPGHSIERLTIADVCAAASGYIRRDGTEGPIPKATMWKHFKSVQALAAAVVENLTADNRQVPDPIAALAARDEHADTSRNGVDAQRLEARFSARQYDIARLAEEFDAASARNEQSDMLFWAAELAERHLQRRRRGERRTVIAARDWARRGIGLVDSTARLDCMMGIRCTRTAAAAETALCRKTDYEPTGLSRIRSIKETEMAFADTLGWQVRRELAHFHAEHARALSEEDPDREMRSHRAIAATVIELCGPDPARILDPRDTLRAEELADIIVGLHRIDMAYATHPEYHELHATIFGDSMADTTRKLLACFPTTTSESHRHEGNVRALLRLDDLARQLDRIGPADESGRIRSIVEAYEQAAIDLLRTAEYGAIRDILVARYLVAKAQSLAPLDGAVNSPADTADPARTRNPLIHPHPAALIQAAAQFYDHTAAAASPRGATGILRTLAVDAGIELRQANPPEHTAGTPPSSEFDTIAQAINDLVLITITRRNRLTDNEIEHLLDMVDPMYYYITSGRN
ncbi:hypothetical protein [Nocardia miyunensis]|uniref:hypothetical protein n=1 Tax=Nocardia miyunensis TaxID=282684 RepID=UPI0012F49BCF|nr:hypothetical protein [Nocardia miyunensis]